MIATSYNIISSYQKYKILQVSSKRLVKSDGLWILTLPVEPIYKEITSQKPKVTKYTGSEIN